MPESWKSRLARWGFNFFPAWRGTGAWVTYIAEDWKEVRVRLPLSWRTRNYVGTIFGGSLYGAADPMYMIMLIKVLGPDYVVWDKAATIRFRKPGKTALHARFFLTEDEIADIRRTLEATDRTDRVYLVELSDANGVVHATVEKVVQVRRRGVSGGSGETGG